MRVFFHAHKCPIRMYAPAVVNNCRCGKKSSYVPETGTGFFYSSQSHPPGRNAPSIVSRYRGLWLVQWRDGSRWQAALRHREQKSFDKAPMCGGREKRGCRRIISPDLFTAGRMWALCAAVSDTNDGTHRVTERGRGGTGTGTERVTGRTRR